MMKLLFIMVLIGLSYCEVKNKDQTGFYKKFGWEFDFDVESGYVSQKHDDWTGYTFYQLVYSVGSKADKPNAALPLIIWLNGGPGCASQFGLFQEIGPFSVSNKTETTFQISEREYSWNKQAHLLFVDQPFGAGLSYTDSKDTKVNNTVDAAKYFAEFLRQFFEKYDKLRNLDLYIFGESFAGHYIPAISKEILNNPDLSQYKGSFKGVGIGDGWTSPLNQVTNYASYLYSAGLVDDHRRNIILQTAASAQAFILNGDFIKGSEIFEKITDEFVQKYLGQVNVYNIHQYNNENVATTDPYVSFLNTNKQTFDAPDDTYYQDCNNNVYKAFANDISKSYDNDVVYLLSQGRKVLLYNGQLDFIVNTPGALQWINSMKWENIYQWKQQSKQLFKVKINQENDEKNQIVGWMKKYNNFVFANIYKAGHMVPSDQPIAAYHMVSHFLKGDDLWE